MSGRRDAIRHDGDVFELRCERVLAHSIERVWAAISEPGAIAQWLAPADLDPRPGGRYRLAFSETDVVETSLAAFDPPRLLAFRWIGDGRDLGLVRWELEDLGGWTRLVLTHAYTGAERAEFMAGWQAHLLQLDAALDGAPIPFPSAFWHAQKAAFEAIGL